MVNNTDLNFSFATGYMEVKPTHEFVKNQVFNEDSIEEAKLANAIAAIAEKSGMLQNELNHIFPAILRMLKNNSEWAK